MLAATVGVLGVVIGAAASAAAAYALARRREQRELRTAARVLLPELLSAERTLTFALWRKRWSEVEFQTDRWKTYEVRLAATPDGVWELLTKTYTAFALLNKDREIRPADEPLDDGDDLEYVLQTLETTEAAIVVVRRLAEVSPDAQLSLPEYYGV